MTFLLLETGENEDKGQANVSPSLVDINEFSCPPINFEIMSYAVAPPHKKEINIKMQGYPVYFFLLHFSKHEAHFLFL